MTRKYQFEALVAQTELVGEAYCRLTWSAPEMAAEARPGHFVTVRQNKSGFPLLRRPFSIHRVLDDGRLQILFKVIGAGTRQLAESKPGDAIDVVGPLGDGLFRVDEKRPNVLLVAGGIGVAPLLFLAETMPAQTKLIPVLLFGGATARDLPALDDFRNLGIEVRVRTEDGGAGRRGLVTDELADVLSGLDPARTQLLACGPMPMLRAAAGMCAPRGVPCQVSLETVMACGLGSCFGCAIELQPDCAEAEVDYVRVCHEGPVFDAARIRWNEEP